ncbi:rhamnan synthesis F family protein [Rhodomicrobium lacus]|uniref:rhamnan synthesis F family protein n=1 Tax=Rhodomicrobium lacus TaxID=2498452 RepID=UPI000F8D698C|nr:rhamnan synthesis F family protein [Rhodomicrobium lacus]
MDFISPCSFWQPDFVVDSAWLEHAPFAFWLVEAHRPGTVVELGTHRGFSYSCFCQAIERIGLDSRAYAVDTWRGDEHAGFYGDEIFQQLNAYHQRYASFSRLIRSSFDQALPHFEDGSVDLLHIDGRHFYDDVKHDFESWLPKLSDRAVVLFHDTNVREREFGVFKLWAELQTSRPSFEFFHGHGLGVLAAGHVQSEKLARFFDASTDDAAALTVRNAYTRLGQGIAALADRRHLLRQVEKEVHETKLAAATRQLENDRASSADSAKVLLEAHEAALLQERDRGAEQVEAHRLLNERELTAANARFQSVFAELRHARRRPIANLRRYIRWRTSRNIKKARPFLKASFIARMERREQKNAPETLSLLPRSQPANRAAEKRTPVKFTLRAYIGFLRLLSRSPVFSKKRRARFARSAEKKRIRIARISGLAAPAAWDKVLGERTPLPASSGNGRLPTICVVLHAYYLDTAREILLLLRNIQVPFDLFITTPESQVAQARELSREILPGTKTRVVRAQNRGRNFGPMLVDLASNIVQYDLLLHLHTKKSLRTGSEQDDWRKHILQNLIGSPGQSDKIIEAFKTNDKLGVVGPVTWPGMAHWVHHWLSSSPKLTEAFFHRLGILHFPRRGFLDFPIGGMFWARTSALSPLWSANWVYEDFDAEPTPPDGTIAHIIERGISVICEAAGYRYGELDLEAETLLVGSSGKCLHRYFSSLPLLCDLAREYDSVSFDFFDTLFARLSVQPEDVQSAVGHVLAIEGLLPKGEDFLSLRKKAEREARRTKGHGDVNLKEIYAAWHLAARWPAAAVARAEALEREIEARVLTPRASVLAFARELARLGKLSIISDTYFEASFLRNILAAHNADNVFEILASSETGLRKDTAEVWKWIKREKIHNGARYLHIGDNEHSDMQLPRDNGLSSLGLINTVVLADLRGCPLPPGWRESRSDWRAGVLLGPLAARVGGNAFRPPLPQPFAFENARDFGYCILGPIALCFMSWLVQRATADGVDRIYFLARGAYFLHRLYEKLRTLDPTLPEARYLMVSRRAVLPAAFDVSRDPKPILSGAGFRGTFGELLKARLGLAPEGLGDDSGVKLKLPDHRDLASKLIEKHAERIGAHCAEVRQNLRTYLEQEKFFQSTRAALVDLGYSATIQKAIQESTGSPLVGYYFGTRVAAAEVEAGGGQVAACFGAESRGKPPPDFFQYSMLLEALFAGPNGQVDGYAAKGSEVSPVFKDEPESGAAFGKLAEAADGMEAYCLDLVQAYTPAILQAEFDSDLALAPMRKLTSGWGGIPSDLAPALVVDDAFCGNGTLHALQLLENVFGINIRVAENA